MAPPHDSVEGGDDDESSDDEEVEGDDEEVDDASDPDESEGVYFPEERNPQYLVARLCDYATTGKLNGAAAKTPVKQIRLSLDKIKMLCASYAPPSRVLDDGKS